MLAIPREQSVTETAVGYGFWGERSLKLNHCWRSEPTNSAIISASLEAISEQHQMPLRVLRRKKTGYERPVFEVASNYFRAQNPAKLCRHSVHFAATLA